MLAVLVQALGAEIRYDDALNGANAAPAYEAVIASAPVPQSPQYGATDFAATGSGPKSTPRSVLLAWLVLFGLLVVAHVLTISVQR
jgi:hypothetical protein